MIIGIINTNNFSNKLRACDIRYAIYMMSRIQIYTMSGK